MAKVSIKYKKITPFGGIFHMREPFYNYWIGIPTKSAQTLSTHLQGLAQPNQVIITSAHYGAYAHILDFGGPFISEVVVRWCKSLYVSVWWWNHSAKIYKMFRTAICFDKKVQINLIVRGFDVHRCCWNSSSRRPSRPSEWEGHIIETTCGVISF